MKRLYLLLIPIWLFGLFSTDGFSQSGQALNMEYGNQFASQSGSVNSSFNLSMEAWVKPESLSGYQNIFYIGDGSYRGCGIYLEENQLIILYGGVIAYPTGVTLSPGVWTHIALTKDGSSQAYLYLNGSYVAQLSGYYPNGVYESDLLTVGGIKGWVDNFRFWTVERTGGQILLDRDREYPFESKFLFRSFLFEETPGSNGFDEITKTNSLVLSNGATQDVPVVVSTSYAGSITQTGARLYGTVFAKADLTSARVLYSGSLFEYTDSVGVEQNPLTGSTYNIVYADITNLTPDTWYYYKTTAVGDSGYFAGNQRSFITLVNEPTEPADNFTAMDIGSSSATLKWKNGNGNRYLVIVSENNGQVKPVNGNLYSASTIYSESPLLGENSRVVYSGSDTLVTISGLSEATPYYFYVYSFNSGSFNNPAYLTPDLTSCKFQTQLSTFSSTLIKNLNWDQAKISSADIDQDGRMDFAVMDRTLKLYWNNGEGGFDLWWESEFNCYGEGSLNWFYSENSEYPSLAFFSQNISGLLEMGEGWYAAQTESWPVADNFVTTVIDYNKDGKMDLLVSRDNYPVLQIFKNKGNGSFLILDTSIPFLIHGNFTVGDFNKDGYPDVAYSGSQDDAFSKRAGILWNNSGTGFINANLGWSGAHRSDIKTADFDQDGWLDVLYTGSTGDGGRMVALYMNDQSGGFSFRNPNLPSMAAPAIASADYNGDGFPDVVMSGTTGNYQDLQTILAINDGTGNFAVDEDLVLPPLYFSSVSPGDVDHDGDADVLLSGYNNQTETYQVYLLSNNGVLGSGQNPNIPTDINEEVNGNSVLLSWETPLDPDSNSLLYDIKLGTYEFGENIIHSATDDTGYVRIPSLVTSGPNPGFMLKRLPPGIYFWNVQAVDATFLGSGWSESGSFEIITELPLAAPEGLKCKSEGLSVLLNWSTDPGVLVDYYTVYAGTTAESMDSVGFVPDGGVYKSKTDSPLFTMPDPEFIYSPVTPGNIYFFAVTVTNRDGVKSESSETVSLMISPFLSKRVIPLNGSSGKIAAGDLNNDRKMDLVVSPNDSESNLFVFLQQEDSTFLQIFDEFHVSSNSVLADLNRDGLLDIISIGNGIVAYLNTGNSEDPFNGTLLCPIEYSGSTPVIKTADYDNDGDLDFFILSSSISLVGINISDGETINFDIAPLPFPSVEFGSVDFADSDRDGDLDMLVSGYFPEWGDVLVKSGKTGNPYNQTLLFLNDRIENTWTLSPYEFPGISKGGAAWGDFNNDGYPDVLINGTGGNSTRVLELFKNTGGEGFEKVGIPSGGLAKGNIKWADLNKDGLLDYTYFGCSLEDSYRGLRVAIQDGSGNFNLIDTTQFDQMNFGDLTTADMDGDGDQDIIVFADFYMYSDSETLESESGKIQKPNVSSPGQLEGHNLVIYENQWTTENTPPAIPENLTVNSSFTKTTVSWNPSTDSETPADGLTYHILLATVGEGINPGFNSEINFETGWNYIQQFGINNISWTFDNLTDGNYLARVQSVDPGYMTSGLSEPFFFTVNSTVPVELESFIATRSDGKVFLKWETATETTNAGFEIQKSKQNGYLVTGGHLKNPSENSENKNLNAEWVSLGFVSGKGTSTEKQTYTFVDPSPYENQVTYYRLKQVDLNGTTKYSKVIEVQQEKPLEFALNQNFPNPFNPETTIPYSVATSGKVSIVMYDILGRQVKTLLNESRDPGFYTLKLTAGEFASGIYYYKMQAGQFTSIKKLTILK